MLVSTSCVFNFFRKFSYLSDIAKKVFSGQGLKGYELALNDAIKNNLEK